MKESDFGPNAPGRLVSFTTLRGETELGFVPQPLPLDVPMSSETLILLEEASNALGNLNGIGYQLENPVILARNFLRQEAVASTRIEGTQTDFRQLVLFEADASEDGVSNPDDQEALNYVSALLVAWNQPEMAATTLAGLRSLHKTLMESVRGASKNPGAVRSVPVFIGGAGTGIGTARFVPPPPEFVGELLVNLISDVKASAHQPRLIQLAILHYQFETIHPFEDGNGRTGRLLLPLYLNIWGLLDQPLLSLSMFFEKHRSRYIDLLYRVNTQGDWNAWIVFVLQAIRDQSRDAALRAGQILDLQSELRVRYGSARSPHTLAILDQALSSVAITVDDLEQRTQAKRSTIYGLLRQLESGGVMARVPISSRKYAFVLVPLLEILSTAGRP